MTIFGIPNCVVLVEYFLVCAVIQVTFFVAVVVAVAVVVTLITVLVVASPTDVFVPTMKVNKKAL